MELGVETETGDVEGDAIRECPWGHVTEEAIREGLDQFLGEIEQVPPIYSAIKVRGKRAYELARKGEEFELEPRPVTIESLELLSFDPPRAKLHTRCGSGTYVRALVRDLGGALATCAYTTAIRRTAVGRFTLDEATPLADITSENFSELLLPPIELMRDLPSYTVDESMCTALGYGQNIQPEGLDVAPDTFVAVANADGELVAVTVSRETDEGLVLRPKRVLKPQH